MPRHMRQLGILLACAFIAILLQVRLSGLSSWSSSLEVDDQLSQAERQLISLVSSESQKEPYICDPRAFGAIGDGLQDNSAAFNMAIQNCSLSRREDQRILMEIPAGIFLTGSFNLTSKMTLRLRKHSKVLGATKFSAYPLVPPLPSYGLNRDWAKDGFLRPVALIFGYNVTDVVIEGAGTEEGHGIVDGNGGWWWAQAKNKTDPLPYGRPSLLQCMFCSRIYLRKIVLQNPAFWNTHFYASKDVLVEHVSIRAPYSSKNTDGINLDSVSNAIVRHCVIASGDDAIAIKSGLNKAGTTFGMPSHHIHLHDLEIRSKCLSLGSEMSGGIHNVLVENVRFGDQRLGNRWHGIFIKSSRPRGGVVQDLVFRNITGVARPTRQTKVFIEISMSYGQGNGPEGHAASEPPRFRNFTFRDIASKGALVVANLTGLADSPVTDVYFENVTGSNYRHGILCTYAENVQRRGPRVKASGCHSRIAERPELDLLDAFPHAEGWKTTREELIKAVFGQRTLPTANQPIREEIEPKVYRLTWDISRSYKMKSTVFHAELPTARSAVLWHHGHHDCICPAMPDFEPGPYSKVPAGFQQATCAPGCIGIKHAKDNRLRRHATWWDLDNVTRFFHALGYHVFILSMPLVGVNFDKKRSSNRSDHWWFQQREAQGDYTLRYFCEPVVLTINYALSLGLQDIHLAGLSGGAWTTSLVAAMDPRIKISLEVAGVIPYSMRFAANHSPTHDIGDYEQICDLPPHPFGNGARHYSYGWRKDAGRAHCQVCNYKCQFLLSAMEAHRRVVQLYHEDDSCCFAAANRHSELRHHEEDIRRELRSYADHGWFTAVVTDHRKHELSRKDKKLIAWVLEHPDLPPESPHWNVLPCDVLHGESNDAALCKNTPPAAAI